MAQNNIQFESQYSLPVNYKNIKLDGGYHIDLIVENKVIVELKSVEAILPIHQAQILTYMKLSKTNVGLMINFNVQQLTKGLHRFSL